MWNWIKLTPLIVTPGNLFDNFQRHYRHLDRCSYNLCFIFLPSPVMAKTGGRGQTMKSRKFQVELQTQESCDKTRHNINRLTSNFTLRSAETTIPMRNNVTHHQLQNMLVAESHFLQSIQRAVVNKFQYWLNLWEKARPAKSVGWFFKSTSESMMDRWVGHWTVDRGMGAG